MDKKRVKIRDGFQGEKLISIPSFALTKITPDMIPGQPYVTHIGYFPKARYHYRLRPKGCEDDILFYCLQGKGYYAIGGVRYELKANQYVIIPATVETLSYWADQDDPWTIYWVHFTGEKMGVINRVLGIGADNYPVYIPYNETGLKIWEMIYESLSMGYSIENMMHASLCLSHLLATFLYPQKYIPAPLNTNDESIVERTIEYMKANIDKKLTIDDMAGLNNMSLSHFSKLFRLSTGMPPIDYFIHLKMQRACHLLYTTDLRIKQIATVLGYEDSYYFSRLFKKSNNVSPEEYRASVKKIF